MMGTGFAILVVDDEVQVCRSLCEVLRSKGYRATYETDPTKVLGALGNPEVRLVLLDIRMPEVGGIDLLVAIKREYPSLPVIMISGHATVDSAVRAMKYGALNLFTKPIKTQLLVSEIDQIWNSLEQRRIVEDQTRIVSADPKLAETLSMVATVAPTSVPVLITGESGTGKELVANALHAQSARGAGPLLKINCASIPESLLESELFGHEKGAFTDAKELKRGLFELAAGGTIFFDEIGDMSTPMQAKLLRVLQDGRFVRVGGTSFLHADCRIIAATNRDLHFSIREGAFREDLYYRLAVVNIHLPALRDRKGDILPLARYFLDRFGRVYGKRVSAISDEVTAILLNHSWPGNVRELENFMERAVIFSRGDVIQISDLAEQYRELLMEPAEANLRDRYDGATREVLLQALSLANGVKQDAARLLRIDRKTLYNRMKKLKLL